MKKAIILLSVVLFAVSYNSIAQLKNVIVEEIPVTQAAADADENLTTNHITYRVFVQMIPGSKLLSIATNGSGEYPAMLNIETTTSFYNDPTYGLENPIFFTIPTLDEPTYYDSWVTLSNYGFGTTQLVPMNEDTDGTPDGLFGSGLGLSNATPQFTPGADFSMFGSDEGGNCNLTDASMYSQTGVEGPTSSNTVCIGQFTTDGEFSFDFNLVLRGAGGAGDNYSYTISTAPSATNDTKCHLVSYPRSGCMDPAACNYDSLANTEDNSTCVYPEPNCYTCIEAYPWYEMHDNDGDGVANCADTISGCTNPRACNYNVNATEDDGHCLLPVEGCEECGDNNDLVKLDFDNDGICNKQDTSGCAGGENANYCNYNQYARHNDGSCNETPSYHCTVCDKITGQAILLDYDNDGICNYEDETGCTNPLACLYNEHATIESGDCSAVSDTCHTCIQNNNGVPTGEVSIPWSQEPGQKCFCEAYPEHEECFCKLNPGHEDCFCKLNPNNIDCFCELNPNDPDCQSVIANASKENFRVFPNPADQFITIRMEQTGSKEEFTISIQNTLGKVLYTKNLQIGYGVSEEDIYVGNLSTGIYFVTVQSSSSFSKTVKISKQ